jgi:hypothetical protein
LDKRTITAPTRFAVELEARAAAAATAGPTPQDGHGRLEEMVNGGAITPEQREAQHDSSRASGRRMAGLLEDAKAKLIDDSGRNAFGAVRLPGGSLSTE